MTFRSQHPPASTAVASPAGEFYVTGSDLSSGRYFLARVTATGQLDTSFNSGSAAIVTFTQSAAAYAVAVDNTGEIYLGGAVTTCGASSFAAARLTSAGALDNRFDTDGMLTTAFTGCGSSDSRINGVAITPDGYGLASGQYDFALARYNAPSGLEERRFVEQDANHNVTSISDALGNVVERYEYTPYGVRTVLTANWAATSPANTSSYAWVYGHQGGRLDPTTGDWYFRNRDLWSAAERWTQPDPLGYVDGGNVYEYVRANPLGHVDPSGTMAFTVQVSKARPWKWEGQWHKVGPIVPGVAVIPGGTSAGAAPVNATCYHYRQYYYQRYAVLFLYTDATDSAYYRWGIGVITGYADASKAYEQALTVEETWCIPVPIGYGQTVRIPVASGRQWAAATPSWNTPPLLPTAGISGPEPVSDIKDRTFSGEYTLVDAISPANPVLRTPPPPF